MAADGTALPRAGGGAHRRAWRSLLLATSADALSRNVSRKGGNRLSVPTAELALYPLFGEVGGEGLEKACSVVGAGEDTEMRGYQLLWRSYACTEVSMCACTL